MPRPGAEALELLANPLNATILKRLAGRPKRLGELRRASGAAPQTTVRAYLKTLEKAGLVALKAREDRPAVVEWTLTDAGSDLLTVASALERWLGGAPEEPLPFGSEAGKMAIRALVGGWSSTVLCLLAAGPLTLTELSECIRRVSYPALERRLSAMWLVGQLETVDSDGKGRPYEVTEWLQRGVKPLAAAIRWEYSYRPTRAQPLSRSDTEATLLLAMPLLRVPFNLCGTCSMGVEINDEDGSHCGVSARIDDGGVVSYWAELENDVDATVTGTPPQWAQAVLDATTDVLELTGEKKLATGLVSGLHATLFGNGVPRREQPQQLH